MRNKDDMKSKQAAKKEEKKKLLQSKYFATTIYLSKHGLSQERKGTRQENDFT